MAGNTYFQFKQFTIRQDRSAMKVCTDACTFGAWVNVTKAAKILDIGTGTGLLALMSAQRNTLAQIDAVEIEPEAFAQAGENALQSPYASRIHIFYEDVRIFEPGYRYDTIISNPPFFQSDLLSPKEKKNLAHHAGSLTFDELLAAAFRLLNADGTLQILLPVAESEIFIQKALVSGWCLVNVLALFHTPDKKPFRKMMVFRQLENVPEKVSVQQLFIYEADGKTYTSDFRNLLSAFYLKF